MADGELVAKEKETEKEGEGEGEEAKNSLVEGVTSRKSNDLEWVQVSDDEFLVREIEDACSEGSDGTEERKNNNEPDNNDDEFHML